MAHESELDVLKSYIDNFNPDDFSSDADFKACTVPTEKAKEIAMKIRERLGRKHKMTEAFKHSLEFDFAADENVCISQEEIDELLASA